MHFMHICKHILEKKEEYSFYCVAVIIVTRLGTDRRDE